MNRTTLFCTFALAALLITTEAAQSQTIDPFYASAYSFEDLGSANGVPTNYGGLTVKRGDPNTLLLGGAANGGNAAIYNVGLVRDSSNFIRGLTGTATLLSPATGGAGGGIDGGLAYGPDDVLFYTSYSDNRIGQIKPGSSTPDKIIDLNTLGVGSSVGSLNFVPGDPNHIKIASYNTNRWYDARLTADGTGTFNITNVTQTAVLSGGLEGIAYVPAGSPLFAQPSVLVAEYGTGNIVTYEVDSNYDPIASTRRVFISGLSGAEGATIDALSGDFLFSTYGGGNRVVVVHGFAPVPGPGAILTTLLGGIPGATLLLRRRMRKR